MPWHTGGAVALLSPACGAISGLGCSFPGGWRLRDREHLAGTGLKTRGQRRELWPHPGPKRASSPLTCCVIPNRPPPPTDAAGACASSPQHPLFQSCPHTRRCQGSSVPTCPGSYYPKKEIEKNKMHQINCKQKCTRGAGSVPWIFGIKGFAFTKKRSLLCIESRAGEGHRGAKCPRSLGPSAGSPPGAENIPTAERA